MSDDPIERLRELQNESFAQGMSGGAAKAQQAVAQAAAMAVQDATDSLRNISTVSSVAIGAMLSQIVESNGEDQKDQVSALIDVQAVMDNAVQMYGEIGKSAAAVLRQFSHPTE